VCLGSVWRKGAGAGELRAGVGLICWKRGETFERNESPR
jgi:hypothetical protein